MATLVRAKISDKNQYYIDKHRHYELKHFCLQYPEWKKKYDILGVPTMSTSMLERVPMSNIVGDPTARFAINKVYYKERIELIERIAVETDRYLCAYILKAVTEGLSYNYLKTKLNIPCSRDTYYNRYRRFFWLLSESRQ